jgi:hypothetical protein
MRVILAAVVVCAATSFVSAEIGPPVDLRAQASRATQIVVGKVLSVQGSFEPNEFGDRIIVSHAFIESEETLKGPVLPVVEVVFEGGTVGDISLRVSDMPSLRANERAVLFLDQRSTGVYTPHGRGAGILKLDAANKVQGSAVTLDEVRSIVRATLPRN